MEYLEFHGSFRYASRDALDRALCEARDHLDDDELGEIDRRWMQFLSRRGMTVHVAAIVPDTIDRYLAAVVLGALARGSAEGKVELIRGNKLLDTFTAEDPPG